jgi:2-polyprenyl-3-methyl-5-hydroxy-6-metoxy-1,4-benzoquinol methylase
MNFHPIENSYDTAKICVPKFIEWYKPKSVLDLGCNIGAWLKVFDENGIKDIFGIDGSNMMTELMIEKKYFRSANLTKSIHFYRKFSLCLCLEVAEHIEEKYTDILIKNAVRHSNTIIWSAATKGQGGYNHVNEQPHEYWIEKFKAHGYKHRMLTDMFPVLPHDYYRQNLIEFKKL